MNFSCPYIANFIFPTDELIFFRGVGIPPTRFMLLVLCVITIPIFLGNINIMFYIVGIIIISIFLYFII